MRLHLLLIALLTPALAEDKQKHVEDQGENNHQDQMMMTVAKRLDEVLLIVAHDHGKVKSIIANFGLVLSFVGATNLREDLISAQITMIDLAVNGHRWV